MSGAQAPAALRYRPLLVVLAAGAAVRIFAMAAYDHAVFNYYGGDSARYLRLFQYEGLFGDEAMPAGYPAFLHAVRAAWSSLPFTIAVQHLLGLATAVLLFAAVRRFGGPPWLGLVPAAVVALGGDQIFLEHALLTETLSTFAIALGVYALARAYDERSTRWLVAAGALLAVSALVRNTALLLPVIAAGWSAAVLGVPGIRGRLRPAAAVTLSAVAVLAGYIALARTAGDHDGLVERGPLNLYMRVAQFADCDEFDPPAGAEGLCESTPKDARPGPLYYGYDPRAPRNRVYGGRISYDKLRGFARGAILHQPLDYARTVLRGELRYFAPEAGVERDGDGAIPEQMSFGRRTSFAQAPASLESMALIYDLRYSDVGRPKPAGTGIELLDAYQELLRLDRLVLVLAAALALLGAVAGRGRARHGATLFALFALYLYALPPMVLVPDVRYAVTPGALVAAAAALGALALAERRGGRPAPATPQVG